MALHIPQVASLINKTSSCVSPISKRSFSAPSLTMIQCKASSSSFSVSDQTQQISRRSGNFKPDIWDYDYIQSLDNKYKGQAYEEESRKLEEEVRILLSETVNRLDQLELVDTLQRLGLGYHFKSEISKILGDIYNNNNNNVDKFKSSHQNLHATALEFRLLRQHGYHISTDVFDSFNDERGRNDDFDATSLSEDIKGMLSLYEASFLLMEDETILEKATDFTTKRLKDFVTKNSGHELTRQVKHALEVPLHWTLPRWEARWFISEYEKMPNVNPTLLKLAKLDYNMVQAMYQEEVKSNISWWEGTGLEKKVNFFRCRVVDNYVWGLAMQDGPEFGKLRKVIGNLCGIITLTDDMYDTYGTLQELELFTEAVLRWDANDLDYLPDYMKVVFFAIYNFVHEVASDILEEKGLNVYSYLKKGWQDLCKAMIVEARWYHGRKTPRLKEYLENAWIPVAGPLFHLHSYLFMPTNPISNLDLDSLQESDLIYFSGLNFRLLNDLGSFKREKKTGDVPSSIQLYMNEAGVSEEEAIQHIKCLVHKTWQKINRQVATSPFSRDFNLTAWQLSRVSIFFYCSNIEDDTYTLQHSEFEDLVHSLIFEPFPII